MATFAPYQLVCEGKADETFFSRLLRSSGKNVDVRCPKKDDANGGLGKSAINNVLVALQAEFPNISRVVVVVDADDDPAEAFAEASGQIAKANARNPAKLYPVPATANTLAVGPAGSPSVGIVVIPLVTIGCLDTVLLPSFEERYAGSIVTCVDSLCACVADPHRGVTAESKIRLRALITASQPKRPGISLSNLLEEKNCPISLAHNSFDQIRNALNILLP